MYNQKNSLTGRWDDREVELAVAHVHSPCFRLFVLGSNSGTAVQRSASTRSSGIRAGSPMTSNHSAAKPPAVQRFFDRSMFCNACVIHLRHPFPHLAPLTPLAPLALAVSPIRKQ